MANPHPSFVVHKVKDDKGNDTFQVFHLMDPRLPLNNSHGYITKHFGLPDGEVMRIEIWAEDLINWTDEPSPWAVDKLPSYATYYEDLPEDVVTAVEEATRNFLSPHNIRAYISTNPDARVTVEALFNPDYVAKWEPTAPSEASTETNIPPIAAALMLTSLDAPPYSCAGSSTQTYTLAPEFFLEDLRNPNVWGTLPPSRKDKKGWAK